MQFVTDAQAMIWEFRIPINTKISHTIHTGTSARKLVVIGDVHSRATFLGHLEELWNSKTNLLTRHIFCLVLSRYERQMCDGEQFEGKYLDSERNWIVLNHDFD